MEEANIFPEEISVVEVFKSIQGEGPLMGRLSVFVRFAGCNLSCPFCDTPNRNEKNITEVRDLRKKIMDSISSNVTGIVITGGEPSIHFDDILTIFSTGFLKDLRGKIETLEIETNGFVLPDWSRLASRCSGEHIYFMLNISPKFEVAKYTKHQGTGFNFQVPCSGGVSVKLLYYNPEKLQEHLKMLNEIFPGTTGMKVYIQPIDNDYKRLKELEEFEYFGQIPSIQLHKLIGVI